MTLIFILKSPFSYFAKGHKRHKFDPTFFLRLTRHIPSKPEKKSFQRTSTLKEVITTAVMVENGRS